MENTKQLLIEDVVLAQILVEAIDSGDYITCDRCGMIIPADQMYGSVCHSCAGDLIQEGLEREAQLIKEYEQELEKEAVVEALMEDYIQKIKAGIPVGAFELDLFI